MLIKSNFIFILIFVLIIFLLFNYLLIIPISIDSGYYLSIARDFYSGKVYFSEIASSYNPLAIVIIGAPYLFSEHPNFQWFIVINLLFLVASSYVLRTIMLHFFSNQKNIINLFVSFFFLGNLMLDSRGVILEPISVFFQLLALLLYIKSRQNNNNIAFFVGLFIALSFLSKQYGLFILLPILIDILWIRKLGLKFAFELVLGLVLPIILMALYYCNFQDVNLQQFILYLLGKGIVLDVGNGTGSGYTLLTYSIGFVLFLFFNLFFILIPYMLFIKYKNYKDKNVLFFSLILISSFTVLYFASYLHYFQYIYPYLLMLFLYLLIPLDKYYYRLSKILMLIALLIITVYSTISLQRKMKQEEIISKNLITLLKKVPKKSAVYLEGISPLYYYACDYSSIDSANISYTFPGYISAKTISKYMDSQEYIIIKKNRLKKYKSYIKNYSLDSVILLNEEVLIIHKK